jgi:hypothetical protein
MKNKIFFMKYTRLTKEQLEELHPEFINFLATQSITGEEWSAIKADKPEVAEEEIDIFSDLVWEGVLNQASYLEQISPMHIHMFCLAEKNMHLIALKLKSDVADLTTKDGFGWLRDNLLSDEVEVLQAHKNYSEEKNQDKFTLLQQGAAITKGDLYNYFNTLINE